MFLFYYQNSSNVLNIFFKLFSFGGEMADPWKAFVLVLKPVKSAFTPRYTISHGFQ